ncbi:MAG TPA: malectin [Verrucomicrobiae bacterium]|nr:malectin [Verrucomicrobiae bacterium]
MKPFMNLKKIQISCLSFVVALAAFSPAGCASSKKQSEKPSPPTAASTVAKPQPAPSGIIRIDAGSANSFTDSAGNVWLADQGFADGDTIERDSDLQITNTPDPGLYRTEHYGMSAFSYNVPNGKYTVKLHFCETYDGITGEGQRVFSFSVGGHDFKDFDVWQKAGGPQRAYVVTVDDVNVTDGKLDITFTQQTENPEINGIEIIPAP